MQQQQHFLSLFLFLLQLHLNEYNLLIQSFIQLLSSARPSPPETLFLIISFNALARSLTHSLTPPRPIFHPPPADAHADTVNKMK